MDIPMDGFTLELGLEIALIIVGFFIAIKLSV